MDNFLFSVQMKLFFANTFHCFLQNHSFGKERNITFIKIGKEYSPQKQLWTESNSIFLKTLFQKTEYDYICTTQLKQSNDLCLRQHDSKY
jgi:hypothetical protein